MIGLDILKRNNCEAFPVNILIALHVFALHRKDGKTTPITSELVGEYFAHDLCLDNGWDVGSGSKFEDEVVETDLDSDPTDLVRDSQI